MRAIAHIETDLPQKFGIPRNSFLAPHLQGRIIFEPEFALPQVVEGLEDFSHLWLIWQFENGVPGGGAADVRRGGAVADTAPGVGVALSGGDTVTTAAAPVRPDRNLSTRSDCEGLSSGGAPTALPLAAPGASSSWSPTVRPPRLGGAERKGVFATRSPFRPNPIGLTCVKLDHIEFGDAGPVIHVLAADLRDGTPILDIKPYIPFADCHPEATGGWIDDAPWHELEVYLPKELQDRVPASKLPGLIEVLRQDPRRAGSKHEPERVYHLAYARLDVAFTVDGDALRVVDVA